MSDDGDQLAVYQLVRQRIKAALPVSRTNRVYGPRQIGAELQFDPERVKIALSVLRLRGWLACEQGRYALGAPPAEAAFECEENSPKPANRTPRPAIPPELAERIGMQTTDHKPEPQIMLDYALRWSKRGLCIFPCRRFLGIPLVTRWYAAATKETAQIVEWWSDYPDADIAAVPDRSGHFAIVASGEEGADSLAQLEDEYGPLPAEFRYANRMQDAEHLWLRGGAVTSHNRLGHGLHVIGRGHYVYLSPSWAPDHHWKGEMHA